MRGTIFLAASLVFAALFDGGVRASFATVFHGNSDDQSSQLVATSDEGLVFAGATKSAGQGGYDIVLMKVSAQGEMQWNHLFGGSQDDVPFAMRATTDGGFILAGITSSGGQGGIDALVVKCNSQGQSQWARTYGTSNDDYALDMVATSDGGYAMTGVIVESSSQLPTLIVFKIDSSGTLAWKKQIGQLTTGSAIDTLLSGDLIVGGVSIDPFSQESTYVVIRMTQAGAIVWSKEYGASGVENIHTIQAATDGGAYIAGYTQAYGSGDYDWQLIRIDANGNVLWSKRYGGSNDEVVPFVIHTQDGGLMIAGSGASTSGGVKSDTLMLKLGSDGAVQWQRAFEYPDRGTWCAVRQTTAGNYVLAGLYSLADGTATDAFVMGVDAGGSMPGCSQFQTVSLPSSSVTVQAAAQSYDVATPNLVSQTITLTSSTWAPLAGSACSTPTSAPSPTRTSTPRPLTATPTPIPTRTPTLPPQTATPTLTPTLTLTPTHSPTMNPSLTWTPSPSLTASATPTFTPTGSLPPTATATQTVTTPPTHAATASPTPLQSVTATTTAVTPEPSPTPANMTSVEPRMPLHYFSPGYRCWLTVRITSEEPETLYNMPLVVMLDLNLGVYWFYPSWRQYPPDFDYLPIMLTPGSEERPIIDTFFWPDTGNDSFNHAHFYGTLLNQDATSLFGEMGQWDFGWGPP